MVSRKKSKRNRKEIVKKSKRNRKRILDGGLIDIIIKPLGGERYTIKIDDTYTIGSIISECREKSPIDETKFKYVLKLSGGKILSNSSKISDYGIGKESTLKLTTKNIAFCGLYVFTDYERSKGYNKTTNEILILNDDNTGHLLESPQTGKDPKTYKPPDVVWTYNETNNILKILINNEVFLINTSKYFGYYNSIRYVSPLSSYPPEYQRKDFVFKKLLTKESKIEFLTNFNPLIHSLNFHSIFGQVNQKLLRVSFDDGIEFKLILKDLISSNNMFFLEHIIKVFRYMDKGVLSEVFKFDNSENMKKSIEIIFSDSGIDLFSRSPEDTCRKELMAIIDRIPKMDIFDK